MNRQQIVKRYTRLILFIAFIACFSYAVVGFAYGQEIQVNQTLVNKIQSQLDNNTRQFEQMCLGSNSSDTNDQVCSDLMFEGNEIMRDLTNAEMGIIGDEES
jgi:hypothetical protein